MKRHGTTFFEIIQGLIHGCHFILKPTETTTEDILWQLLRIVLPLKYQVSKDGGFVIAKKVFLQVIRLQSRLNKHSQNPWQLYPHTMFKVIK